MSREDAQQRMQGAGVSRHRAHGTEHDRKESHGGAVGRSHGDELGEAATQGGGRSAGKRPWLAGQEAAPLLETREAETTRETELREKRWAIHAAGRRRWTPRWDFYPGWPSGWE
jgi:hypothetical protein